MTLSKKSLFVTLKWVLLFLFVGGLTLAILDEALRLFRAGYNKEGTMVDGFALYEKNLTSDANLKTPPVPNKESGWEFVEFYRHKFECEFWRFRKQNDWENQLGRKLRERPEDKSLLHLPMVRYACGASSKRYPAGQGWGLF